MNNSEGLHCRFIVGFLPENFNLKFKKKEFGKYWDIGPTVDIEGI